MTALLRLYFVLLLLPLPAYLEEAWKVVVLGCGGGPLENNLSGYLLAPKNSSDYIALDAGSLLGGIYAATAKNSFSDIRIDPKSPWSTEAEILRSHIKAYVISHAHLDHVAGLILNSTCDTSKPILGLDPTIDYIRDNLFNWKVWPNFGSEGEKPQLGQYPYQRLKPGQTVPLLDMTIEPFLLSHPGGYASTAFLIRFSDAYIVYLGDTAPDALEPQKHLKAVWQRIAPLIQEKKVSAIFLECSYTNAPPPGKLFGHLNPKYMLEELHTLASLVDPQNPQTALKNFPVIVTHIKETLLKPPSARQIIQQELENGNDLGLQFIFPEQGQKIEL